MADRAIMKFNCKNDWQVWRGWEEDMYKGRGISHKLYSN
jgi:hypothetical protein